MSPLAAMLRSPIGRSRIATPGALVLSVDWAYGPGDTGTHIMDNGNLSRWGGNNSETIIDVVTAASVAAAAGIPGYSGMNLLRLRTRGSAFGQVVKDNMVPASTSHVIDLWTINNAARWSYHGCGHNIFRAEGTEFQIQSFGRYGGEGDGDGTWKLNVQHDFGLYPYPNQHWQSPALTNGALYRIKQHIEYNPADGTQWRAWPRIYNASNVLIHTAADFTNSNGTNNLAAFYDVAGVNRYSRLGYGEGVAVESARQFGLGLEGATHATGYDPASPAYTYYGKLRVTLGDFTSSLD